MPEWSCLTKSIRRRTLRYAIAAVAGMTALYGQPQGAPPANPGGGLRLENIAGFTTYYSSPGEPYGPVGNVALERQSSVGGTATISYNRFQERSGISFSYRPSYLMGLGEYGVQSHNHSMSFSYRRNLSPKWTHSVSVSGAINSLSDSLFVPTSLSTVASTPATFDQLSSAIVGGRYTNSPLTAALTSAPVVESPAAWVLYGNRLLTSGATSSLSYSRSTRLSFHGTVSATRTQPLSDDHQSQTGHPEYLVARSTSAGGDIGVSYSLSPRTQVSGDWATARTISNIQDTYTHRATVSLARVMSPRWFVQVQGGTGWIRPVRDFIASPAGAQYLAGGSIGYRTYAHTFLVQTERSIGDTYGLGAGSSVSASAAWNWNRPGSNWSLVSNFGQQWLGGNRLATLNTWRGTAGLLRKAGPHVAVLTQYAYTSDSQIDSRFSAEGGRHMVRVSVLWIPNPVAVE